MPSNSARREWISYLRVSTHEQAERDLSLPAQRHAVEEPTAHAALLAAGHARDRIAALVVADVLELF